MSEVAANRDRIGGGDAAASRGSETGERGASAAVAGEEITWVESEQREKEMIDARAETLLAPKQACRVVPGRTGRGISLATLWRWMSKGRRGVALESVLVGGARYTSMEAIARFIAACNGGQNDGQQRHADRIGVAQQVERALDVAGF